jgi:NADPH:quinone reductase-like Zn-dependent oxidoreductase
MLGHLWTDRFLMAGMLALALGATTAAGASAQQAESLRKGQTSSATEGIKYPDAQKYRQLEQQNSILSLSGADQMLKAAQAAARDGRFAEAVSKNQEAVTMLNQMSTFHSQLSKSFAGIDNRIADEEKQMALQAAIKRDEATYQLALIHRAQGKPELAVPLLVRIAVSQNPTRDLGQKAYQQLYEIGFVKSQYPRQ